jgi:phage tail-like protein
MATGQRVDPFLSYNFLVELDGIARAAFSEVSGLDATTDPVEYREGGENTTVRQLPGMTKYSNIVLKWGMSADMELYDWHRQIVLGEVVRKDGSIIVLDRQAMKSRAGTSSGRGRRSTTFQTSTRPATRWR